MDMPLSQGVALMPEWDAHCEVCKHQVISPRKKALKNGQNGLIQF